MKKLTYYEINLINCYWHDKPRAPSETKDCYFIPTFELRDNFVKAVRILNRIPLKTGLYVCNNISL